MIEGGDEAVSPSDLVHHFLVGHSDLLLGLGNLLHGGSGPAAARHPGKDVERDRDALALAFPWLDAVQQPAREHHDHATLRRDPRDLLRTGTLEAQHRGIHPERRHAWVMQQQVAAVGLWNLNIIDRRPEGAAMHMRLVQRAWSADVRPRLGRPFWRAPLPSDVRIVASHRQNMQQELAASRAGPMGEILFAMPAAVVRSDESLVNGPALLD